jgi:FMN phosphatase YigB (HAD superfamily)
MKKLLITDLDNTLYDWVSYFAASFNAMLDKLTSITQLDRQILLNDFKKVHERYGNTEYPFSILELDSLIALYGTSDKEIIRNEVDEALHAFNSERKNTLKCYDGVLETLKQLSSNGVNIVAHTEAPVRNSLFRLEKLGIKQYFSHLYAPRDRYPELLDANSQAWLAEQGDFLILLSEDERKPNPSLLVDICAHEDVSTKEAIYVGDSIVKDIAMAKQAGITSVWAEYGKQHLPHYWSLLVAITHWTEEDIKKEEMLKKALSKVLPDHTLSNFNELTGFFNKPVNSAN